jgi:tRNA threonylcarbamoyladenosine biosynthesis protein TsaB
MNILALDTSAKSAACAVMSEDGKLLAESFVNNGYTHSKTLMPMIEGMLKTIGMTTEDIGLYGVCNGPGSFTGIRIGVSTVKGMAFMEQKPCIGVSSLLAAAYNAVWFDGIICPVMDARRQQVYNALFDNHCGQLERVCADRAISIEELYQELSSQKKPVILVGDGAELCYNKFNHTNISLAPEGCRFIRGSSVAGAVLQQAVQGAHLTDEALVPVYLRPSQAEREKCQMNK